MRRTLSLAPQCLKYGPKPTDTNNNPATTRLASSTPNKQTNERTDKPNQAEPEFDWTPETVGVVDSSFFWGYIVTQIPGGFLAARYPANRVFGSAIATSSFLNLLLPVAAKAGYQYVMLLRIFQGLVEVSRHS